ncbi:serine protease gd [Bactrocera neohumeralis]|uniref:serine protease gd n=1 Tax=Bactrocera neohumeralis TaxID=98809 RepID=UPI00216528A5|nr:serine protease gd [Bactrocera neohumeralis]
MRLHFTTILIIILQQINRIFTQSIPISPCPKIFQYRFDGAEWFGILSVRNTDFAEALQIKVTLSMRGKPTTSYLGEIELLSRGQFHSNAPVLYKIKFPKTHFPPKLLHVTANNHVICVGQSDLSIFVTQIQLEHTRKFTFIGDDEPSDTLPEHAQFSATLMEDEEEDDDDIAFLSTDTKFSAEHLPITHGEIELKHMTLNSICGKTKPHLHNRASTSPLTALAAKADNAKAPTLATNVQRSYQKSGRYAAGTQATTASSHNDRSGTPLVISSDELPTLLSNAPIRIVTSTELGGFNSSLATSPQPLLTRGAWPWLAAIYVNNLTSLAYQCAGTLVSAHVVISSAHCFHFQRQHHKANEVLVFLGRHNLRNWNEEHSIAAPVSEIFLHPEYDATLGTYDADIAVLVLKIRIRFNTYILPACLWSGDSQLENIIGERGFLVGWGFSHTHGGVPLMDNQPTTAAVPHITEAPIVSNEVCFAANPRIRSLSSNRTFCAGLQTSSPVTRSAIGPCTGDSGAGLLLERNNRWMLRGTVSAALPAQHKKCTDNQYVIYADLAKYLDWIMAFTL